MQELLTLVLEQLRGLWRFRWTALAIAWAIAIVGWLYVYSMPNVYKSQARVHVDTESAIRPLLSGMAVMPNTTQQVDLLIRTVLSRPHLADIARRTGLDLAATSPEQEQSLLDTLAQRISLRGTGGKTDLYNISFTSQRPETAQAVVREVINIMTVMGLDNGGDGSQSSDSTRATGFLQREVDKYKQQLTTIEQQLATFKKNNAELMPGAQDYVSRLQSLNASIANLQDQLAAGRNRKSSLAQQLGRGGSASVPASASQQVQAIDQQISQREQQLQQLLGKYTSQHPDVLSAQRDIARLKQDRASTLADLRAHPGRIEAVTAGPDGTSGVRAQLNNADVDISTLQFSIKQKQDQLAALRGGADQMNDAQAQLAELTRNYQVTNEQYQKLLTRLYSAHLSTDVQQANDPVEFRVIDPPEKPAQPSGPQRTILLTMALFAAIGAGAAFAFFLSQIRPVYTNRRALTEATGLPVIGAVSMAWTTGERVRRKNGVVVFAACCATLLVGYAMAVLLAPLITGLIPSLAGAQAL